MTLGDINGDGKLDLVAAGTNFIYTFLGTGNGTFNGATFDTNHAGPEAELADVNGDGKLDLVLSNEQTDTIQVLLGNGNGTFGAAQNFSGGDVGEVLTGDFTGNNLPDLLVASDASGNYTVSVLLNDTFAGVATTTVALQASQITVTAPTTAVPVKAFNFTVTATNLNNSLATAYRGTVHFTSSDPKAVLPADATLTGGVGIFAAVFQTSGVQSISATDVANTILDGTSNVIGIGNPATHFVVSASANALTGTQFNVTVAALDAQNQPAAAYFGTVHFSSSDSLASLPPDATLTFGTGVFSVALQTQGNQTITVTDISSSAITGTSNTVVDFDPPTHFAVLVPANVVAGVPFNFTVSALTAKNGAATTYNGTLDFTSTDGSAMVSQPSGSAFALTNGVGAFSAVLKTAGDQRLSANDAANSNLNGVSGAITVSPAATSYFGESAAAAVTAGVPLEVTVTAEDQYGNTVRNYSGTVELTSTLFSSLLPTASTLSNGVGVFSVTLDKAGFQSVIATDTVTPSIVGLAANITGAPRRRINWTSPRRDLWRLAVRSKSR